MSELEYELAELMDAAPDDETRQRYRKRWLEVRAERRNLPLGMDLTARTELITAQDCWSGEIEALRGQAAEERDRREL